MQITVDTQKDSKEHLQHLIRLLQTLVGEQQIHTNAPSIFEQTTQPSSSEGLEQSASALASLFEEKQAPEQSEEPTDKEGSGPQVQLY